MAITGNSSYIPTMNQFIAHWGQCNAVLGATPLIVPGPKGTTVTVAQFTTRRDVLTTQYNTIQGCLTAQQLARAAINTRKTNLLAAANHFNAVLDAYYRQTDFYAARPAVPSFSDGQETFSRPLGNVISLWTKLNSSPAPAGLTLPIVLPGAMDVGSFASAVSQLQFAYAEEDVKAQDVTLARATRDRLQNEAYEILKSYRGDRAGEALRLPGSREHPPAAHAPARSYSRGGRSQRDLPGTRFVEGGLYRQQ